MDLYIEPQHHLIVIVLVGEEVLRGEMVAEGSDSVLLLGIAGVLD